jgi:hypothetical protein
VNTAPVSERHWHGVREHVGRTTERLAALLRTVRNPNAATTGGWCIADTAAHLELVCAMDAHTATFGRIPFPDPEVLGLIQRAGIDDLAHLNAVSLRRFTDRDPVRLAGRIEDAVAGLLLATADEDGRAVGPWLGGARLSVAGMLGHLLNELLLHGLDIARADGRGRDWDVPPEAAALALQVFFLGVLGGDTGRLLAYHTPGPRGLVRAELRSRHHPPVVVEAQDGRLRLGHHGAGPLDVRIWSEPAALMIMLWGRSGRLRPLLTGRVAVWGRRPWRALRFLAAVRLP